MSIAGARNQNTADKAYAAEARLNLLGLWSDALGFNRYTDAAGSSYATGQNLLQYTGGGQTINSTSTAVPSGMSCAVSTGNYVALGCVSATQGANGGQQALRLQCTGGGSCLSLYLGSNYGDFGAAGIASQYGLITALNTDLQTTNAGGGIAANDQFGWIFIAWLGLTAGTFSLGARCQTSGADPWTFNTDSFVLLHPC